MERLDYILSYKPPEGNLDSFNLVGAYCFCLDAEDTCTLLTVAVRTRPDLREVALRKTCSDIEVAFAGIHQTLLNDLLQLLSEGDAKARQSAGYCLSRLAEHVPQARRREIQEAFLASKYITIRRRGYKSVTQQSVTTNDYVRRVWESRGDPECAWLIVKTFPPEFLVENRSDLATMLSEGWQYARLYLRIAEVAPDLLRELREIDDISYVYVLAKTGASLTSTEAIELVRQNVGDERFGLLVWSLGRLGQWDALRHIEAQLPTVQEAQFDQYRANKMI